MKNTAFIPARAAGLPSHALLLGAVAALVLLLAPLAARAQTINLMAPSIANVSGMLTARFGVTVVEKVMLKGELQDGAQLALRCAVSLYKARDYWLDGHLASSSFESVLSSDPLTGEFLMTLPGRSTPLRAKDIETLLREGWGTIEVSLGPWDMLERGQKYSLILNTSMNEADAPDGVSRFIYFWSWDAGADASFQLDFTY
ncbi:MAG: DUF4390 domain-containing protein [Pseudodesulfovibrio sp.]|uniref:DUF4390 domain-containing protein n=1 Tax=Pseudodesulfovibrio aespoeensis (strain ATCC 700646 / DSM 10631 / Aspo-2) TaxID=643562 RepID=E6VV20_PSEA9|nr:MULTISPECIES: DUF4390 domain-containing protein [Pseudodesulfovibrio]MBU4191902.1 DUF4390 domain-containing protein [Pseudomonadota bacterium]ADU61171.1 hypothetical protein Daes_0144 [Pseudodesulfovibrio aespoeensis Aspo-2]MBU4243645.1 DUF4390 domain-containing protein [Pseudomonadota bacterium]MBU4379178.1 DUF4390 domain-containing protein [Pseudomonadota bacterium]MBU4475017.1 DUF4390 domain-containing protein [Pseudomonadota bacterium]